MTIYDLFDKVYTLCAGVCEYAVGRGQVNGSGSISLRGNNGQFGLGLGDGEEDEDDLLQHENEDENENDEREGEMKRGQMIIRQFYHHSFHLHALLEAVVDVPGQAISIGQLRQLTGKWFVNREDYKFWSELARRWQVVQA
jgi:hypothetical protein